MNNKNKSLPTFWEAVLLLGSFGLMVLAVLRMPIAL